MANAVPTTPSRAAGVLAKARKVVVPIPDAIEAVLKAEVPERAIAHGLQAGSYLWCYVEDTVPGQKAVSNSSPKEAEMMHSLALHLLKNVSPSELVVAVNTEEQRQVVGNVFKACPVARAVPVELLASIPLAQRNFKSLVVSCKNMLSQPVSEAGLAHLLDNAAAEKADVIFTATTRFVRDVTTSGASSWTTGCRAIVEALQKTPFTVSATTTVIDSRVGCVLPVCCPRHPNIREEAEQGEGFPFEFCPYPCLSRFEGCGEETHVCTKPCHSGDHSVCTYPNATRLRCGHVNIAQCNEPADCGQSKTIERACSHEQVSGWDSVLLKVKYASVAHTETVNCGATSNPTCEVECPIMCPTCGADRKVKCCHRIPSAECPGGFRANEELAGACPHCHTLYHAIWKSIRDKEMTQREATRAAKERESFQLRMEQVEAAKKGVFVEGQRVWVSEVSCVEDRARYQDTFGDRSYTTAPVEKGKQGTVRARTNHPDDVGTLVYLVESQGKEHFICIGRGLELFNVVSELQSASKDVLLITSSAAPELEIGQWRPYAKDDCATTGIFDATPFAEVPEVQSRGAGNFYAPESPPTKGELFLVEARIKHVDGSNVNVFLLRNIGHGCSSRWMLATKDVFKMQPYQRGQKVLVAAPQHHMPSGGYQRHFPDVKGWYDEAVNMNDSGTIVGVINDGSDSTSYHFVVRLDVRKQHAVFNFRGLELDEEAEKLKREDETLLEGIGQQATAQWEMEQDTARLAYAKQREAEARHMEETAATRAAVLARQAKQQERKLLTSAERTKRDQGLIRLREDAQRKYKRINREEEDRTASDIESMKKQRDKRVKEMDGWAEEGAIPDNTTVAAKVAQGNAVPVQPTTTTLPPFPGYAAPTPVATKAAPQPVQPVQPVQQPSLYVPQAAPAAPVPGYPQQPQQPQQYSPAPYGYQQPPQGYPAYPGYPQQPAAPQLPAYPGYPGYSPGQYPNGYGR